MWLFTSDLFVKINLWKLCWLFIFNILHTLLLLLYILLDKFLHFFYMFRKKIIFKKQIQQRILHLFISFNLKIPSFSFFSYFHSVYFIKYKSWNGPTHSIHSYKFFCFLCKPRNVTIKHIQIEKKRSFQKYIYHLRKRRRQRITVGWGIISLWFKCYGFVVQELNSVTSFKESAPWFFFLASCKCVRKKVG